jgi:secreted PhoX family phosphatase
MIDSNRTGADAGRYLFMGFETSQAGIQRYDRLSGAMTTLWNAPAAGAAVNFDAARWTPFGTYITAEESWGVQPQSYGRLFELTNPVTATAGTGNLAHANAVARVSHEGLAFDRNNNLYYIDELNGGSIYRYSSATPNSGASYFNGGTNSVLRVGDGNTANATGAFSWVPFTSASGTGLAGAVTITDPNGVTSVDGRATTSQAAFKGTGYQRPEDLEIQTRANGEQVLYVTATTSHTVYSINLATNQIQAFVTRTTIDSATGLAVGAAFTNPDNMAIDADGNIYIVEDQPGGQADVWLARDADGDGVADSVSRWASMSTQGAEPTGLYFDVTNPNIAFINVQHPSSGVDRLIQVTAVPEPGSYALMLAGLGVVGASVRRRRTV